MGGSELIVGVLSLTGAGGSGGEAGTGRSIAEEWGDILSLMP